MVLVRPLAHDEVPHRTVRDVARDVGAVAARVDHVEVVREGFPLTPRHPDRQRRAGDVLDPFHHVDEGFVIGWAHGREAHTAVAQHDGRDAVGGRRLEGVVPRDLAVVVGMEIEEAGGDDRAVGVDLPAAPSVDRTDLDDGVAVDGDVAGERRGSGAVDDGAASNDDVEHGHAPRVVRRLRPVARGRSTLSRAVPRRRLGFEGREQ